VQIKGLQVMENQRFSRGILYHKPSLQRREKSSIMVEIRAGEGQARVREVLMPG
jgi:hypothetical protein